MNKAAEANRFVQELYETCANGEGELTYINLRDTINTLTMAQYGFEPCTACGRPTRATGWCCECSVGLLCPGCEPFFTEMNGLPMLACIADKAWFQANEKD